MKEAKEEEFIEEEELDLLADIKGSPLEKLLEEIEKEKEKKREKREAHKKSMENPIYRFLDDILVLLFLLVWIGFFYFLFFIFFRIIL